MELPDFKKFCLNTALYETFSLNDLGVNFDGSLYKYLQTIKQPEEPLDVYCVDCQKESTFRRTEEFEIYTNNRITSGDNEIFMVEMCCTRNTDHRLYFIFRVCNFEISKIGQHYSIADINIDSIKKYRTVLGNERYREFSKSVGLASHGIGIGSFVYLRRIFEGLVFEAYDKIKNEVQEAEFNAKRMDEKISLLKAFLPDFLVENKSIYSILSKGIHSLSENECLKYYDIVKLGIELILDEKIEQLEKLNKIKTAKKSITNIAKEINK